MFPTDFFTLPVDPQILRKRLPTKVLHGKQNPQETYFLRNFWLNSQVIPLENRELLVVRGVSTLHLSPPVVFFSTVSCYHYTIRAVDADLRFCSSFASLVLFFNLPVNVSRAMHLGCCLFL